MLAIFVSILLATSAAVIRCGNEVEDTGPLSVQANNFDELPPNDEALLLQSLLTRYNGYGLARPVAQVNKTLDVALLFIISEFLGIEELSGSMKVTAMVVATWQDDLLRWNPDKYHQLKAIPMKTHDVFLPTIVKDGNGGTQSSVFMTGAGQNDRDINSMVWVHHTGQVEAKVTGLFVSSCTLNLDDFPFDSQTCRFVFKSWRFNDKRISLHQARGQKLSEEFKDSLDVNINANANWMMKSVTSEDTTIIGIGENFSAITYEVIAARRSDYYTWNVLMPSFAMAVLLLATFFMPFGPERSMFCITLVLTMNLFQQALNTKLPVTSEVIPYVRQTTVQVMLGIAITIESAFVWWIAAKNKRSAVPGWLRWLVPKLRTKVRKEHADALRHAVDSAKKRLLHGPDGVNGKNMLDDNKADSKSISIGPGMPLSQRNSFGSRLGNLGLINNNDAIVEPIGDEFEVWGEWLEVAQMLDILFLFFVVGSMVGMPIFFYRHRFL